MLITDNLILRGPYFFLALLGLGGLVCMPSLAGLGYKLKAPENFILSNPFGL